MIHPLLTNTSATINDLTQNPLDTVLAGEGQAVLIIHDNQPAFYCVPAQMYQRLLEDLEDAQLNQICNQRQNEASIKVSIDAL
jgi:antitoxin StbD